MTSQAFDLADLGWRNDFASQLSAEELERLSPARVTAVHRTGVHVVGRGIDALLPPYTSNPDDEEAAATVGDWLLLEPGALRARRRLERTSLFKRRAAGTGRRSQLIAANVDTLFIVSSCNQDFNVARLERYLALARAAEVTPVVALTKADLAEAPGAFARIAAKLLPGLLVEALDARDVGEVARLAPWCGRGQTIALLGSSGVGKSTLVSTLTGETLATQGVRKGDQKGRHATTARALHRLPSGGWLLDTPGMRELALTDASLGVEDVFADIATLAGRYRFSDCGHVTEPGCAVRSAIEEGALDPQRLKRWRKLAAEEARNTESLSERRARERSFGRMAKRVLDAKRTRRDE